MSIHLHSIAFLIISVFLTNSLPAQYTFTGNGEWTDPANWENGIIAPTILYEGQVITIAGNAVVAPNCNEDWICEDDFSQNYGTIIISSGASLYLKNYTQFGQLGHLIIQGSLTINTVFEGYDVGTISIHNGGILRNLSEAGNQGLIEIFSGGSLINAGIYDNDMWQPGTIIIHDGGSITNEGPNSKFRFGKIINTGTITNKSTLQGNATVEGDLINEGTLSPGYSPGTYTISGDYTATAISQHFFEVEGLEPGAYDVLEVAGTANLNGNLNVSMAIGLNLTIDDEVPLIKGKISGMFSNASLPAGYKIIYKTNEVVLKKMEALPVRFIDLDGQKEGQGIKLTWKVAEEQNVSQYEVERSWDGKTFHLIGIVDAIESFSYYYTDLQPTLKSYYRIKSVDADGKTRYSKVIFIEKDSKQSILKVFPSPARNELVVQHSTTSTNNKIMIVTTDGKLIKEILLPKDLQQTTIDLSGINSGIYILRFDNGGGNIYTIKILKL